MSISFQDLQELIHEALEERDPVKLRQAAGILAEQDEEEATRLLNIARRWDDGDWAYDNSINN